MLLRQGFSCLLSIGRFLLFLGETATQPLELLFSFTVVPGVVYCIPLGVRQEAFESYVYADFLSRWYMLDLALGLDTELAVVAISSSNDTDSFDQFSREGFNMLFLVADQAKTTNPTSISEDDMFPVGLKFPTSRLVFDASIIVLKLWIAFLPWLLFFTILIE